MVMKRNEVSFPSRQRWLPKVSMFASRNVASATNPSQKEGKLAYIKLNNPTPGYKGTGQ
jgi:hypothetical protein